MFLFNKSAKNRLPLWIVEDILDVIGVFVHTLDRVPVRQFLPNGNNHVGQIPNFEESQGSLLIDRTVSLQMI